MILETTKYLNLFIIGFAICNITVVSVFHWIAQDAKSEHSQIVVFNIGDVIITILCIYAAITLLLITYDILGKKLDKDRKNLSFYGLKSAFILAVVFYDGSVLISTIPAFFQDIANSGSDSVLWNGIALSAVTPFFGLLFNWKRFQLKINFSKIA